MTTPNRIHENIRLHESIADRYDSRHPEIYNDREQIRLREAITFAVNSVGKDTTLKVMDYGCGTGNLTRHLLTMNCHVVTADVTPSFVAMASALDPSRTEGHILNGEDLREFPDSAFDLIATYSVLHHIPDYLTAVKEMIRVLRPGGVLMIDHEASAEHYQPSPALLEFRARTTQKRGPSWYAVRLFSPLWWKTRIRQMKDPRFSIEGDIHVWPDDHIEWDRLRDLFKGSSVEVIMDESYLHYQGHYDLVIYDQYAGRCNDMHILIGKKR